MSALPQQRLPESRSWGVSSKVRQAARSFSGRQRRTQGIVPAQAPPGTGWSPRHAPPWPQPARRRCGSRRPDRTWSAQAPPACNPAASSRGGQRQHLGGAGVNIMQQDDAAAMLGQSGQHILAHLIGRDRIPVIAYDIGAEDADVGSRAAAREDRSLRSRGSGKTGAGCVPSAAATAANPRLMSAAPRSKPIFAIGCGWL